MTHLWLRAEQRDNETRTGLTPEGAARLIAAGLHITIEDSPTRCIPTDRYAAAGASIARQNTWPDAPSDAIIFGLKELPEDGPPLSHRHIMFGHAFKGQPAGQRLLARFGAGKGTLYDLEYLVDDTNRRVAAFGYWAGYAGAAVALKCWIAQQEGQSTSPIAPYPSSNHLLADLQAAFVATGTHRPTALIVGALGRAGTGAADLCTLMGVPTTRWDMEETAQGGPFPQVLAHDIFFNCVLARPGTPVFVPASTLHQPRRLSVIGDIACDPESDFSPIKVYDRPTSWGVPALCVHKSPPLDVTAIDNLPSMLPVESSEDFAEQLLPSLLTLDAIDQGIWAHAKATFDQAMG